MARDAADGGGDGGVAEAAAAMTTARLRQAASHAPIPPLTTSECVSLVNSIRPEKCDPRGQPAAPRSHGQATDLAKMNPPVKAADGSLLMTISSRSIPMAPSTFCVWRVTARPATSPSDPCDDELPTRTTSSST